jgi:general secretion pathway protein E
VRVICPECKKTLPREAIPVELRQEIAENLPEVLYEGQGCPACAHTGYQGRTGIYELLLVDETVRQLILRRADAAAIKQAAVSLGMQTLAGDGWSKVAQGLSTSQEVLRVTQE